MVQMQKIIDTQKLLSKELLTQQVKSDLKKQVREKKQRDMQERIEFQNDRVQYHSMKPMLVKSQ